MFWSVVATAMTLLCAFCCPAEGCWGRSTSCSKASDCCTGLQCVPNPQGLGPRSAGLERTCEVRFHRRARLGQLQVPPAGNTGNAGSDDDSDTCPDADVPSSVTSATATAYTATPDLRHPAYQGSKPSDPAVGLYYIAKGLFNKACKACTATAVTANHILTAAHCVVDKKPLRVAFGKIKSQNVAGQVIAVKNGIQGCRFDAKYVQYRDSPATGVNPYDYAICLLDRTVASPIVPRNLAAVVGWADHTTTTGYPLDPNSLPTGGTAGDPFTATCISRIVSGAVALDCLSSKGQSGSYLSIDATPIVKGILTQASIGTGSTGTTYGVPFTQSIINTLTGWIHDLQP